MIASNTPASSVKSLPSRGAWIEIEQALYNKLHGRSLPSRGAWIEIEIIFL